MLQINILKNNVITNSAEVSSQDDANAWLASQQAVNAFGRNQRIVRVIAGQMASEDITDATSAESGTDELGLSYTDYNLPADYTVEQVDITAQLAQDKINQDSLAYLASTDWYVIRAQEDSAKPVPSDIIQARQTARDSIVR